jgi:hypothetical protein
MVVSPFSDHVIPGVEVAISATEILGQAGVGVGAGVGVVVDVGLVVFRALATTGSVSGVAVGSVVSGLVWLGGVGLGLVDGAELEPPKIPNATPERTASATTAIPTLMSLLFLTKPVALASKLEIGLLGLAIST